MGLFHIVYQIDKVNGKSVEGDIGYCLNPTASTLNLKGLCQEIFRDNLWIDEQVYK